MAELESLRRDLELKNKFYTQNVLNEMILKAMKQVLVFNPLKDVKITNIGADVKTPDVAGQFISQVMNSLAMIEHQMTGSSPLSAAVTDQKAILPPAQPASKK